jgi:hypothetical protein
VATQRTTMTTIRSHQNQATDFLPSRVLLLEG